MSTIHSSESRIEEIKMRSKRCVCKFCGGPLNIRRILFNDIDEARVEIFCNRCDRIEYGVEPEIYATAMNFVENLEFNYYNDMDQNEKTHKMNVAKVCEIMAWGCKHMGLTDKNGFRLKPDMNETNYGEFLIMSENTVDETKSFEDYLEES